MIEEGLQGRESFFVLRSDGTAFAGDLRGDALSELAQGAIVEQERKLGLAENIDETGRDDAALGVDFALGVRVAQVSNGGDAIAADGHIRGVPRVAGTVDDVAVADD